MKLLPPVLSHLTAMCLRVSGLALLLSLGFAQQLTQRPPAESAEQEASVVLPPFEVSTDQDRGYMAQNTASGSRLNTSLRDVAAPVSVFTTEFLQDIGITDIASLADYAVSSTRLNGMQGDVAGGNEFAGGTPTLRVRGLGSTRMVNFFARSTEVDIFNIERVELSRGPNALLFGLGGAGGVFNTTTKKADLRRAFHSPSIRMGDYDAFRASIDVNQPLVRGVAALRLNAVHDERDSWRPHEYRDAERFAIAGRWQINRKLLLNAEYEQSQVRQATQRQWSSFDSWTAWNAAGRRLDPKVAAPGTTLAQTRTNLAISTIPAGNYWVYDSTLGAMINYGAGGTANIQSRSANTSAPVVNGVAGGSGPQENPMLLDFSVVPRDVSIGGPGIGNVSDVRSSTASLTYEPVDKLFLEFAFNLLETEVDSYDIGNTELRIQWDTSPTTITGAANPNAGRPYIEVFPNQRYRKVRSYDPRLTTSYDLKLGRFFGRHRLAALLERRDEEVQSFNAFRRLNYIPTGLAASTLPEAAALSVRHRTYVDLAGPAENVAAFNIRADPTGTTRFVPNANPIDERLVNDTAMLATQSHFWKDRVAVTFGYRKDWVSNFRNSVARGPAYPGFTVGPAIAVRDRPEVEDSGITRTKGAVFHATEWLSLFYNASSSFNLGNASNRLVPSEPVPNPKGESEDGGAKLSLLDGRLFATFTYFQTSSRSDSGNINVAITRDNLNAIWDALDAAGVLAAQSIVKSTVQGDFNAFTFDSDSKGWEFELVANPTAGLRLSFNLSDSETVQTNTAGELLRFIDRYRPLFSANAARPAPGAGATADATVGSRLNIIDADHLIRLIRPEGAPRLGEARYSANLRANQRFTQGRLRGFSAGAGLRWRGDTPVGYTSSDPALRRAIEVSGFTLVDANIGYERRAQIFGRRTTLSFQLNVSNLLDEDDLVPSRVFDDGSIRTYRFQAPRDWFFTVTARF
jgi:iron complex outermembrane receptor protein